jgi:succinate dehydrogenase/fumarate reductase-like Fe-S protein
MSCSERCPKQLSPGTSIAGLKRAALSAALEDDS